MTLAVDRDSEIRQLKALLFEMERARIDALETHVASLQRYVGAADRLEAATADILVAALERAEVNRPRELANAIAPSVVSAIRSEIKNSHDLMVDALYPITGRLVSAAVANSFKELLAFLEQRINALTSTELWIGRVKSLVTGRPISEFVLANSNPRVSRLLFIERGAGRLIADWRREEKPNEGADLLSAMVAAILEFSVQALTGQGNLQKLDFGGREIVLRASPQFILAAECLGSLRPADDARIDALFFDAIESINKGESCDGAMLASLAASIEIAHPAPKKNARGKIILFVLLALAAAILAWFASLWVSRTMLERRTDAALEQLAAEQPLLASFPLHLDFDHAGRILSVSGIEPSQVDTAPLIAALAKAAAPYRLTNRIGVVPGPDELAALRADTTALQQSLALRQASIDEVRGAIDAEARSRNQQFAELGKQHVSLQNEIRGAIADETKSRARQYAGLQDEMNRKLAEEAQSRDRQFTGLNEQYAKLQNDIRGAIAAEAKSRDQQFAALSGQNGKLQDEMRGAIAEETKSRTQEYAELRSIADGPAERLGRFMASTAIFFSDDNKFADDAEAGRQIRELAALLANNDLRVRIVGHADGSGSDRTNKILARKRAEAVTERLVALGIAPSRLFVVSRSSSMPISDDIGGSIDHNRRVSFETVFKTEASQ